MATQDYNINGYNNTGEFNNPSPMYNTKVITTVTALPTIYIIYKGKKQLELSNHLGNVLATLTDRRIAKDDNGDLLIDYYNADISSTSDYYAFGSSMPGREIGNYRFGFNGEELMIEIAGEGMSYDLGERFYDSRLGKMFSLDPLMYRYPWQSPYAYCYNSPICVIDFKGLGGDPGDKVRKGEGLASYMERNGMNYYDKKDRALIAELNKGVFKNGVKKGKYMLHEGMVLNVRSKDKNQTTTTSNNYTTSTTNATVDPTLDAIKGSFFEWEWCQFSGDVEEKNDVKLVTAINVNLNMTGSYSIFKKVSLDKDFNLIEDPTTRLLNIYGSVKNSANIANPSYTGFIIITKDGEENTFPMQFHNNKKLAICDGFCFDETFNLINYSNYKQLQITIKISVCSNGSSAGGSCAIDNHLGLITTCWVEKTITIFSKK